MCTQILCFTNELNGGTSLVAQNLDTDKGIGCPSAEKVKAILLRKSYVKV